MASTFINDSDGAESPRSNFLRKTVTCARGYDLRKSPSLGADQNSLGGRSFQKRFASQLTASVGAEPQGPNKVQLTANSLRNMLDAHRTDIEDKGRR